MNLIVDIGNSQIKVAKTERGEISSVSIVKNLIELDDLIEQSNATIISSVRKLNDFDSEKVILLTPSTPIPIKNDYHTPESLGMDRIAGIVGCNYLYPNTPCLMIDCGTCITYDFVDQHGNYKGGGISPGIQMKFKALNNFTDALPLVSDDGKVDLIGTSTESCIQSGVLNGSIAEMDQIIAQYLERYPQTKVILTGGDGQFFETNLKATIFAQPKIVLIGLNRILEYNVEKV